MMAYQISRRITDSHMLVISLGYQTFYLKLELCVIIHQLASTATHPQSNDELLPTNVDPSIRANLSACAWLDADGPMTMGNTPSVLSMLVRPETTTLDTTWK